MLRKGYPADFASLVSEMMHTEYTSQRMEAYISRSGLLPPEEVADEMLAIIAERDRLIEKHRAEHAQSKLNALYGSGLSNDEEQEFDGL